MTDEGFFCLLPTLTVKNGSNGSPSDEERRPGMIELVQGLPTPTCGDAGMSGAAGYSTASGRHSGMTLTDAACGVASTGRNGRLNPQLCEWMQGLPIGWTASAPLETSELRRWFTLTRSALSSITFKP